MPTASKIISALLMAFLAYFVSDLYKPQLPEGTQVGLMSPINALFGFVMGWRLIGRGAGKGMRVAISYGFTAVAATLFWAILFWSAYRMTVLSTRGRYSGPSEATQDFFSMAGEYVLLLNKPDIYGSLIVGAIFVGWLAENVARRYS
jgi:hypothetical protein